jgi:hypothetical protein
LIQIVLSGILRECASNNNSIFDSIVLDLT